MNAEGGTYTITVSKRGAMLYSMGLYKASLVMHAASAKSIITQARVI